MKLGLINLSLVDGCNLSCRWCDRPDNFSFIELRDLKSIVDKINTEVSFVPLIQVIGSGEAFLHKNIVKAIEIISGIDIPGARVELWTNGTIEKNNAYEELMKLNVLDGICVSFDGYGDKESLEYMRTGAKYEKIISNVAKLVDLRNKFQSKCQIGVSSILPREGQIPFKHINPDEVKTKYWSIFPDVDNIMFRELHTYNGTFERSGFPIAVNGVIGPCEKAEAGQLVVDTKGGVHPCCNDINHSLLVGNILEDNISNIMFNNKHNRLIEDLRNGESISVCSGCDVCKYPNERAIVNNLSSKLIELTSIHYELSRTSAINYKVVNQMQIAIDEKQKFIDELMAEKVLEPKKIGLISQMIKRFR